MERRGAADLRALLDHDRVSIPNPAIPCEMHRVRTGSGARRRILGNALARRKHARLPPRPPREEPLKAVLPSASRRAMSGRKAATSSGVRAPRTRSEDRCRRDRRASGIRRPRAQRTALVTAGYGAMRGNGWLIHPNARRAPSLVKRTGNDAPAGLESKVLARAQRTERMRSRRIGWPANGNSIVGVKMRIRARRLASSGAKTNAVPDRFALGARKRLHDRVIEPVGVGEHGQRIAGERPIRENVAHFVRAEIARLLEPSRSHLYHLQSDLRVSLRSSSLAS